MASEEPDKAARLSELRPFRILFLVMLALGLALVGLSQWRVLRRPLVFSGPRGLELAYQKVVYFDEVQYFEAEPHFFHARAEGDSFSVPQRIGGDLWSGAARGDSLMLVFKSSFALFRPTEDQNELALYFAGKLPVSWPVLLMIPHSQGFRGLGIKKATDAKQARGELRMLEFRDLEFTETAHHLALEGTISSLTAENRADTSIICLTVRKGETSKTYTSFYTEADGFGPLQPLELVARAQTMVTSGAGGAESGELYWLVVEEGAEPGEILRLRYQDGAFVREAPISQGANDWLAENRLLDMAATPLEEGFGLLLMADELRYGEVDAEGRLGALKQVVDETTVSGGGQSLWNFLVPVLIVLMLIGLFSRARQRLSGPPSEKGPGKPAQPDSPEKPADQPDKAEVEAKALPTMAPTGAHSPEAEEVAPAVSEQVEASGEETQEKV